MFAIIIIVRCFVWMAPEYILTHLLFFVEMKPAASDVKH